MFLFVWETTKGTKEHDITGRFLPYLRSFVFGRRLVKMKRREMGSLLRITKDTKRARNDWPFPSLLRLSFSCFFVCFLTKPVIPGLR